MLKMFQREVRYYGITLKGKWMGNLKAWLLVSNLSNWTYKTSLGFKVMCPSSSKISRQQFSRSRISWTETQTSGFYSMLPLGGTNEWYLRYIKASYLSTWAISFLLLNLLSRGILVLGPPGYTMSKWFNTDIANVLGAKDFYSESS